MNKYEILLDRFNNDELDEVLGAVGNNIDSLIKLLDIKGLLDEIDLDSEIIAHYHNDVYSYIAKNHPEKFVSMMIDFFDEITLEDGKIYLTVQDKGDLADLFCEDSWSRNYLHQDTVRTILTGDEDWGRIDDTTDNIYRDVIEDLNSDNLKILYDRVLQDFQNVNPDIYPQTALLEEIAEQQGHDDYVILNEENIPQIFSDEDSTLFVLKSLDELNSDLYQVHYSAYNSAYEDELYENVMNELETYFLGNGEYVTKETPLKTIQTFKIEVNDFLGLLKNYVTDLKGESQEHTFWNQWNFMNVLEDGIREDVFECLKVSAPDWADWSKVKDHVNTYFGDYI